MVEKIIGLFIVLILGFWIFDSIKHGTPLPRYKGNRVDFWNSRKRRPVKEIKNIFGINKHKI